MVPAANAIQTRRELDDAVARKWSNLDIMWDLKEGMKHVQNTLKHIKCRRSLSTVADQREYVRPTDMKEILEFEMSDSGTQHKVVGKTYDEYREYKLPRTGDRPLIYVDMQDEGKFLVTPAPTESADTTTLTGNHTATVTTITCASTADFYDEGRVIIDSEVISYTGKTDTTLTGCTRGVENTTAATHSSLATITERDILLYGVFGFSDSDYLTFYTVGTGSVTATYGEVTVGGTATAWSKTVATGDYFGVTSNSTKVPPTKWYKISAVSSDTAIVLDTAYGEATAGSLQYIVSSPNPFGNEFDALLRSYARAQALAKSNDLKGASFEFNKAEMSLSGIKNRLNRSDVLLVQRGRYEGSRDSQRMRVNMGDKYPIV